MSQEELYLLKQRLLPYMESKTKASGMSGLRLFMLTDIGRESTELLFTGAGAGSIIEAAFGVKPGSNCAVLPGVVSRKKQLIPSILHAVEKMNE